MVDDIMDLSIEFGEIEVDEDGMLYIETYITGPGIEESKQEVELELNEIFKGVERVEIVDETVELHYENGVTETIPMERLVKAFTVLDE